MVNAIQRLKQKKKNHWLHIIFGILTNNYNSKDTESIKNICIFVFC